MASSRRKPKKIDEFFFRSADIRVDVFLTPDNMFAAEVFDTTFQKPSIDELRSAIDKFIYTNLSLEFKPVIAISIIEPFGGSGEGMFKAFLGFSIRRFYYAVGQNTMYEVSWNHYDGVSHMPLNHASRFYVNKKGDAPFEPPCKFGDTYYLPYDEATWVGAEALLETLKKARKRLFEILDDSETLALVGSGQLKLLGAGDDTA